MRETAGIIIIGNEVLSGKFQDSNSPFMIAELRRYGLDLRRISVIPDEIDVIAEEVKKFSEIYHHVFTTGGLGPTHDDITMEAIAKAFQVELVTHDELKELFRKKCPELTPAHLKMTLVPQGTELIRSNSGKFRILRFRNVYIFPGVPELMRRKFPIVAELIRKVPIFLKKVYIAKEETALTPLLNRVVAGYPRVQIGSYPIMGKPDYQVMITLESLDQAHVDAAVEELLNGLGPCEFVKLESES